MRSKKQRVLFTRAVVGCALLCMSACAFAANWSLSPYGLIHAGPRFILGWPLDRETKWSFDDISLFAGAGALYNPSKLDDWFFSGEVLYHQHRSLAGSKGGEKGLFLVGKLTVPISESVENFIGFGPGALWLNDETKKGESLSTFAMMLQAGRNWHMTNGYYFTVRVSYVFPLAEKRKQSFSLTLGGQWNLV